MSERKDWIDENTKTFIHKLFNKEELTEEEVRLIVYEEYNESFLTQVTTEVVDRRRWHDEIQVILQVQETKKYYAIYYFSGLTECQENEFWGQIAQEVEPILVKRIEWRKVE